MCSHDDYVSPYLRRHLRTHEEMVREEAERSELKNRPKASAEAGPHGPGPRPFPIRSPGLNFLAIRGRPHMDFGAKGSVPRC